LKVNVMSGRTADGKWLPGGSPNAGGLTRQQQRVVRMLEDMTPHAAKRLRELINSQDEAIALGAVKEWLHRVAPPPPKQPSVAVAVAVNNGDAHLAALLARARARMAEGPALLSPEAGQGAKVIDVEHEVVSASTQ
jgi:hypothetical protein